VLKLTLSMTVLLSRTLRNHYLL